ncbi:MAG: phosphatidate cytidylyltransferase, partial [Victivallaceae bacterium]|nr:phosphatidate cytidylyltransferase [Victivallaceae bacterium]
FFIMICWGKLLLNNGKVELLQKILVSLGAYSMGLLPLFFLSKIYFFNKLNSPAGAQLLLYMVVVTKSGDTFAYVTGILSNRIMKGKNHKIVPSISPKKSWEGTIGGLFFSVLTSFFLYNYLFEEKSATVAVVLGFLLFLGGFAGDLSESALKRICGVKDSGAIIPGMGGVYDLLDSFIFNAPLFYFSICLFYK